MTATASRVRWEGVHHEDEISKVNRHIMNKVNGKSTKCNSNSTPADTKEAAEVNGIQSETRPAEATAIPITDKTEPFAAVKSAQDHEPAREDRKIEDAVGDVEKKEEKENLLQHETNKENSKYIHIAPISLPIDHVSPSRISSGANTPVTPKSKAIHYEMFRGWKNRGDKSAIKMLSALYGIIIFLLGLAFPLSEVISSRIPQSYYEGFYVYLYTVAIAYLLYNHLLVRKPFLFRYDFSKWARFFKNTSVEDMDDKVHRLEALSEEHAADEIRATLQCFDATKQANHGSFYLRMGAVVFGVGGMIYSGLDFGQYFDINPDPSCKAITIAVSPASRVFFTFIQMYFVFLNAKLQVAKLRSPTLAHFGLMHLLATNMCVWLNAIIEETNHEIHFFGHLGGGKHRGSTASPVHANGLTHDAHSAGLEAHLNISASVHGRHRRGTKQPNHCLGTNLMTSLVESASPFLFPCAIEYSLICAATMYEIWVEGGHHGVAHDAQQSNQATANNSPSMSRSPSFRASRRSPNHYSVDCTKANKGLFFGIFVLVLSIIAMIIFFVLINRDDYKAMAITEVHLAEIILYGMTFVSVVIGMIQMRQLRFTASRSLILDEILIIVAQCGNIAYSIFTILGSQFSDHPGKLLVMLTSLAALIQGITQTIFILDAYKRTLFTKKQQRRKPGREIVTFLLVTNFAMWAMTTMEKSRADAHPLQSDFYGMWQWAIITNISTPLAIFYRYHSTVCLCEIWKRCYKVRDD